MANKINPQLLVILFEIGGILVFFPFIATVLQGNTWGIPNVWYVVGGFLMIAFAVYKGHK